MEQQFHSSRLLLWKNLFRRKELDGLQWIEMAGAL
jgi:hypothetical protein